MDTNDSLRALDGHMQLDGVAQVEETSSSGDSVGLIKGAWEERIVSTSPGCCMSMYSVTFVGYLVYVVMNRLSLMNALFLIFSGASKVVVSALGLLPVLSFVSVSTPVITDGSTLESKQSDVLPVPWVDAGGLGLLVWS